MMPQNVLSSPTITAPFLAPKGGVKQSTIDFFPGGNGIADTSRGLNSQVWQATLDSSTKRTINYYSPNTGVVSVYTHTLPITWLSAAFDQTLRPLLAWIDNSGAAFYYWYDSTIPAFTTTALAAGTLTPYAVLDDARIEENSANDGLIFYITAAGRLRFRQQRDRFGIEYDLTPVPAPSPTFGAAQLTQVGLNINFRMQFQFQYPALGLTAWPPVLLSDLTGAIPRIWPTEDDFTVRSPKARIHQ